MQYEKKQFTAQDSGGDFDSAPTKLSPNAWMNAENVRTLTTDAGEIGNLEQFAATFHRHAVRQRGQGFFREGDHFEADILDLTA